MAAQFILIGFDKPEEHCSTPPPKPSFLLTTLCEHPHVSHHFIGCGKLAFIVGIGIGIGIGHLISFSPTLSISSSSASDPMLMVVWMHW